MFDKIIKLFKGEKDPYRWDAKKMQPRQESYEIVCPYCFTKFSHEDVLFRAARYDNSSAETALQIDPVLNKFWDMVGVDSAEIGDQNPVLDSATYPESAKNYDGSVIISLEDKFGNVSYDRICPHCHNKLPKSAGRAPSNIISVIGGTSVGKTVYIAMLIDILQKHTQNNFEASCMELSSGIGNLGDFDELRRRILNDAHSATDKEYIRPLVFRFTFLDNTIPALTLCFYDFPGEAMADQDFLKLKASHIANASGVILLVDPLQCKVVAEKLGVEIIDNSITLKHVLANLYQAVIGNQPDEISTTPTAIVFTKSDELKALTNLENSPIRSNSNIFEDFKHPGYLDLDQTNNISNDVMEFIQNIEKSFINDVRAIFSNYHFFAVSSLGYSPINAKVLVEPQPCRVDEPFLWLLYQLGYIKGRERNV